MFPEGQGNLAITVPTSVRGQIRDTRRTRAAPGLWTGVRPAGSAGVPRLSFRAGRGHALWPRGGAVPC